jgi:hypothetical protein
MTRTTIKIIKNPRHIEKLESGIDYLIIEDDLYNYMFAMSSIPPKSTENKLLNIRYNGVLNGNYTLEAVFSDNRFTYWRGKTTDGKYQEPKEYPCKGYKWSVALAKTKGCDNCIYGAPGKKCEHSNILVGKTEYE